MTDGAARDGIEVEALLTDQYLDSLLAARDRRAIDVPADPRLDPAIRLVARRLDSDLARVHPSFRFEERLAAELARRAALLRAGRGAAAPMMPIAASGADPAAVARGPAASVMPIAASGASAGRSRAELMPVAASDAATTTAPTATGRGLRAHPGAPLMPVAASTGAARVSRPRTWRRLQFQVRPDGDSVGLPHLDRSMPRPLLIGGALTSAAISIAGAWVAWRRGRPPIAPMARAVRAAHRSGAARGIGLPLDRARRVGARRLASR